MATKSIFTMKNTLRQIKQSSKYASVVIRTHSVWTEDKVIKSPYKNVEIPKCTLNDYVWQNLDRWPQKTISVCAVSGRGYTYEDAFKLSHNFAANLRIKFNVSDGDAVAIMLPNLPDYPLVALGILEAGGVITSINPIYTAYEVQRQLSMSKSKAIVTLPEIVPVVVEALKQAKMNIPIIVVKTSSDPVPEGTAIFNELSEDSNIDKSCLKKVRRSPKDICLLPYSSGTTGLPKGVELSHRNIIANIEQVSEPLISCHNETTATHQDAVMVVLPLFHIYAATILMFQRVSLGAKLVTIPKFHPDIYLRALQTHKTNVVMVAPPLILMMASHPAATEKTFEHIEWLVSAAAPLGASDVERFLNKAKKDIDFRQGYGLTETSPTVTLSPRGYKQYAKTGPPVPSTELRIVDQDLKNLGPNETGEILIRGPQVMRGYKDNPQANAEVLLADGWFRSGDLGLVDEDGVLTIADRLKELIKVKGFQVAPAELEAILREHPSVTDAAVIGVPHKTNGETPKVFVVVKPDQKCSAQDLKDYVNKKVASFKQINDVQFIEAIPKSAAGKILRKVLKEKYC